MFQRGKGQLVVPTFGSDIGRERCRACAPAEVKHIGSKSAVCSSRLRKDLGTRCNLVKKLDKTLSLEAKGWVGVINQVAYASRKMVQLEMVK